MSSHATFNRIRLARQRGFLVEEFRDARMKSTDFEVAKLPDPELPIDELIAHRVKQYKQKQTYEEARRLIPVKIKTKGPIGI